MQIFQHSLEIITVVILILAYCVYRGVTDAYQGMQLLSETSTRLKKIRADQWCCDGKVAKEIANDLDLPDGCKAWYIYNISLSVYCFVFKADGGIRGFSLWNPKVRYGAKFDVNEFVSGHLQDIQLEAEFNNGPHPEIRQALGETMACLASCASSYEPTLVKRNQ